MEDAAETLDNLFEALGQPDNGLPGVLVLPDLRLNGPFAQLARAVAIGRNLPITVADTYRRPMLDSRLEGEAYLAGRSAPGIGARCGGSGKGCPPMARLPTALPAARKTFACGWKSS